jgi:biotin carboxyl carrier protein
MALKLEISKAMKMENEVQSLHAGTVAAVHVQTGQGVQAGQTLIELEGA